MVGVVVRVKAEGEAKEVVEKLQHDNQDLPIHASSR